MIATEHKKGRRLFIGTTNIEAQRGVIWDVGEIASQNLDGSLDLIRKIILASATIPGLFEPVILNVKVDGITYSEIHVDGGVTSQLILYPLKIREEIVNEFRKNKLIRRLFIIRNSKVIGEYASVSPHVLNITQRSIQTLIKYHGIGNLLRLYLSSQRDDIDYNLIFVPNNFNQVSEEMFDPNFMRSLYEIGYELGQTSTNWIKTPPGVLYTIE